MDPKKAASADLLEKSPAIKEAVEGRFSVDDALNRKGFAEFVALHKDAESILEGGPRADEVIQAFNKKDRLIETARKVLVEQMGREIGKDQPLQFSDEDLESVDEHLSKMAVEDTESFLKLADKTDSFRTESAEVRVLEERLKDLGVDPNAGLEATSAGSTTESLLAKRYVLSGVKGTDYMSRGLQILGSWFGAKSKNEVVGANRDDAQKKYGLESNWYGKMQNLDDQIEITQGLIKLQELRKQVVEEMFPAAVLGPIVQSKVAEYLGNMARSTDLAELEKAQAFLERAREASEKGETGTDYLGATNETEAQKMIDRGLDAAVVTKVDEVITNSTLGDRALARLEKSLRDFMQKEKLGSRDKDGYRDFLVKTLDEQAKVLMESGAGTESRAKALLIKRVIIKITNA